MRLFSVICLAAILFVSCTDEIAIHVPGKGETDIPMFFDVLEVTNTSNSTKSMMENTTSLQTACNPNEGKQQIGLWADRTGADGTTTENFFGNVSLEYNKEKTGGNPYNSWNYAGDTKYWLNPDDGIYKFRAFYPKTIEVVESSNATHFITTYNTFTMQEDLLVAYNNINASSFDIFSPVPLTFKHALAALRFQLKFKDEYFETDALTSFWLENKGSQGMSYIGMMVYGLSDESNNITDPEGIRWSESDYKSTMYLWKNKKGVPFKNAEGEQTVAMAYTDPTNTAVGKGFTKNEGWLLIIPQISDGTTTMNFTTLKGGEDAVYSIPIPKITGTDALGENLNGTYFLPGYRYTYTFTLTKTNAEVKLSIAPWNELESSFDIPFNSINYMQFTNE